MAENVYSDFITIDGTYDTKLRYEKMLEEMLQTHKSNWKPNSKGGEPNHRKETR